jgi:hypothetical protein
MHIPLKHRAGVPAHWSGATQGCPEVRVPSVVAPMSAYDGWSQLLLSWLSNVWMTDGTMTAEPSLRYLTKPSS